MSEGSGGSMYEDAAANARYSANIAKMHSDDQIGVLKTELEALRADNLRLRELLTDLVAKTEPLELAYGTKDFVAKLDAARASSYRARSALAQVSSTTDEAK